MTAEKWREGYYTGFDCVTRRSLHSTQRRSGDEKPVWNILELSTGTDFQVVQCPQNGGAPVYHQPLFPNIDAARAAVDNQQIG